MLGLSPAPEVPSTPDGRRWWQERSEGWAAESTRGLSIATRENRRIILRRFPSIVGRLGFEPPTSARDVTAEMIAAVKAEGRYSPGTLAEMIRIVRMFLKAEGSRLATEDGIWRTPNVVALNRRWLTREQLARALDAAERHPAKRATPVVFLAGANGLRLGEIVQLKVGQVNMDLGAPTLTVLGKGRGGGSWRTIAMNPLVWEVLLEATKGKRPSDRVYPWAYRTADADLRAVGRSAGISPLAAHDLRRTFGRLYWEDTKDLVGLQHLYGHHSVEMTAYYIGLDLTQMATGLRTFSRSMRDVIAAVRGS